MKLYGRPFSVYVRTVRLCLEEKSLAYELVPVDPFDPAGLPDWYADLHPFGKIPAFEDGDVRLYESDAIQRYLEARYPEPPLLPTEPAALARAVQAMRIMDSYAYPASKAAVHHLTKVMARRLARDQERRRHWFRSRY